MATASGCLYRYKEAQQRDGVNRHTREKSRLV